MESQAPNYLLTQEFITTTLHQGSKTLLVRPRSGIYRSHTVFNLQIPGHARNEDNIGFFIEHNTTRNLQLADPSIPSNPAPTNKFLIPCPDTGSVARIPYLT